MFEMVGNFVTSVIYIKSYFKQMYLYWMLDVKGLRADVCKYRPEVGKIKFLKNLKKFM